MVKEQSKLISPEVAQEMVFDADISGTGTVDLSDLVQMLRMTGPDEHLTVAADTQKMRRSWFVDPQAETSSEQQVANRGGTRQRPAPLFDALAMAV